MWISLSFGQVEANSSLAYAAFRYLQRLVRDSGMLNLRYFRHTTWSVRGQDAASLASKPRRPTNPFVPGAPEAAQINAAEDYLHDVELRQQVAVGQGELLAVQEGAGRGSDVVGTILVDLLGKRTAEVVVQRLQSLQQTFL